MSEDYGNLDQMTMFVFYCFNSGATVVPFRAVGFQTNEVVLDNDDLGVTWSGSWSNSSFTNYYGNPGDVPYRFTTAADTETATATYTPNIPVAGFYPVYTWVLAGGNRTNQLYRIRHTGGEATVRVPHQMVGNGWVYLGTYYFNAGANAANGAVVISNLGPAPRRRQRHYRGCHPVRQRHGLDQPRRRCVRLSAGGGMFPLLGSEFTRPGPAQQHLR